VRDVPSLNHKRIIRAFEKKGFRVARQGKHITMTDGANIVIVPRNNPVKRKTLLKMLESTGLTINDFKELL
jgi:predicted RNA binding protein YcfA (HicA-like mRNA interferase family)